MEAQPNLPSPQGQSFSPLPCNKQGKASVSAVEQLGDGACGPNAKFGNRPIWGERAVCPLLGPTNQTLPFLVQNGDGDVPHNGILLDFTFCGLVEPQPMDALKMSGWSQASKMVWTATTCSIRGFREQHRMPPVSMDMWGQEGPEQETL